MNRHGWISGDTINPDGIFVDDRRAKIEQAVYQAIGEAFILATTPNGVFDITNARRIADELIDKINGGF